MLFQKVLEIKLWKIFPALLVVLVLSKVPFCSEWNIISNLSIKISTLKIGIILSICLLSKT